MSSQETLVSVVIPAYNAAPFLEETLLSLVAQTHSHWEALLVDDGSSDGTVEIARRFAEREPRLRVITQANAGVSAARNRACREARGEYIAFLDADDLWPSQKLEVQLEATRQHNVEWVYCVWHRESLDGSIDWNQWRGKVEFQTASSLLKLLRGHCFVIPSCVMLSARLLEKVGLFDESLCASEDWDLWTRLLLEGTSSYGVPEILCHYRIAPGSLSSQFEACFWTHLIILRRYLGEEHQRAERVSAVRASFRNSFTLEGDRGKFKGLKAMFDAYREFDPDGYASRVMAVFRRILPVKLFWFVCRFSVIPLAWHMEMFSQRQGWKTDAG